MRITLSATGTRREDSVVNDAQMRNGATLAGAFLIVLGVIFLLVTQGALDLNLGTLWPVFPALAGVFLLVQAFTSASPNPRSAQMLAGTIPLLLGLFFLTITLGIFSWSDMDTLWPIFPLIVGVACIVAYLASAREHSFYLIPGAILIIIAVTFFTILQIGGSYSAIGKLWPIFLVMAGVILLVVPMLRNRRA